MFMRGQDPRRGVVFDARNFQPCSSPETAGAFRYKVAKQRRCLNKYRVDQYLVYKKNSFQSQMDHLNHVSRDVPAPDQMRRVSPYHPVTTSSRVGGFLEDAPPDYFDTIPVSTNATANIDRSNSLILSGFSNYSPTVPSSGPTTRSGCNAGDHLQGAATWLNTVGTSSGNGSVGPNAYHGELSGDLYFRAPNFSADHFDLGAAGGGGMPMGCFDSSSPSTYHMNGSSPTTMFGSFSSSIGPPEHMDMDPADFISSPASGLPGSASMGPYPSTQGQNNISHPPIPMFPITPNPGAIEPETVSPSMLRVNNAPSQPRTSSSSESLPGPYSPYGPFHVDTDSDAAPQAPCTIPEGYILSSSGNHGRGDSNPNTAQRGYAGSKWGRKQLPDKAPNTRQSIFPSNGSKRGSEPGQGANTSPKPTTCKRSKPKSNRAASQPQSRSYSSHLGTHTPDARTGDNLAGSSSTGAATAAAAADAIPVATGTATDNATATSYGSGSGPRTVPAAGADADTLPSDRSAKDDFLVRSRLNGMRYSEIRKLGNYKEAESTLRGRFRTLVKPKEARVRTPQWQDIDDKLLQEAVSKLAKPRDKKSSSNIPWKAVADYISENGGTYHFGNNTCHRRWNCLNGKGESEGKKKSSTRGKKST
ncbi:hypothetical protein VPNG_07263 [Cytospora leucostoma]|uniref:Myb-like domain-containing protein n=1 Tax=Cytospora leucostoma TaxID=1230097 RepID=A0A423WKB1_9PEZI|nr:hypothetical protein VPNG_07263 [Cytospora leucostoma]